MKTVIFVLLTVVVSTAQATGSNHHNTYNGGGQGGHGVGVGLGGNSDSYSNASANGGNSHSNATGGAADSYSGGNAMNMSYSNNYQRAHSNTPAMGSLLATPTAPCALPIGGGGVGGGFGFNFITAYINPECIKQETTKLAIAMGKTTTADEIFCTMEHAENTSECKALRAELAGGVIQAVSNGEVPRVVAPMASDVKRGPFGTTWDATAQQWVFISAR